MALQRRAHHLEVQIQGKLHSDRLALQDMVAELSPVERVYGDVRGFMFPKERLLLQPMYGSPEEILSILNRSAS